MIEITIPGRGPLTIAHLVLDYNGTLAVDGRPVEGVIGSLATLADQVDIHVLTADTFGTAARYLENVPCRVSILPEGAQDIVTQYGGKAAERLVEDNTYTFWVLKEDVWNEIQKYPGKPIFVNSALETSVVEVKEDSVFVSASSFVQSIEPLDVFVNITNLQSRGRLGTISLIQPTLDQYPVLVWEVKPDIADTTVAAVGVCEGSQYSPLKSLWEAWSEEIIDDKHVYGKKNVIHSPVVFGDTLAGTKEFYKYPMSGLERNENYYVWIGSQDWDGLKHSRVATGYSYATFQTY